MSLGALIFFPKSNSEASGSDSYSSWAMCDRSVMILEGFFRLLGGAGVPDRGMIPDKNWSQRYSENRKRRVAEKFTNSRVPLTCGWIKNLRRAKSSWDLDGKSSRGEGESG